MDLKRHKVTSKREQKKIKNKYKNKVLSNKKRECVRERERDDMIYFIVKIVKN
jgi:hypothetical protein